MAVDIQPAYVLMVAGFVLLNIGFRPMFLQLTSPVVLPRAATAAEVP